MTLRRALLLSLVLLCPTLPLAAGPVFYAIGFGTSPVFGTIDPGTATVTPIGSPLTGYGHDIAVSPAGAVYAVIDGNLVTIDKSTGAGTIVGALPSGLQSLAFRADGTLFGASYADLYTVDPATGAGTLIGAMGLPATADNIRFAGASLYVMSAESNSALYTVNPTTGSSTFVGLSGQDDTSLGAFYNGIFLATNAPGGAAQLLTIDPATGLGAPGPALSGIYLLSLDPTSVPEPGTVALLAGGLALLIGRKRRAI